MNYPNEKSIAVILNELTEYCYNASGKECVIKLTLPEEVLVKITEYFTPKEGISIGLNNEEPKGNIKSIHTTCGTVEFVKDLV
jgi:hypothetical protein